jgi:hypothetical protein
VFRFAAVEVQAEASNSSHTVILLEPTRKVCVVKLSATNKIHPAFVRSHVHTHTHVLLNIDRIVARPNYSPLVADIQFRPPSKGVGNECIDTFALLEPPHKSHVLNVVESNTNMEALAGRRASMPKVHSKTRARIIFVFLAQNDRRPAEK